MRSAFVRFAARIVYSRTDERSLDRFARLSRHVRPGAVRARRLGAAAVRAVARSGAPAGAATGRRTPARNGGTHRSARAIERGAERAAGDSRRLAGLAPD